MYMHQMYSLSSRALSVNKQINGVYWIHKIFLDRYFDVLHSEVSIEKIWI